MRRLLRGASLLVVVGLLELPICPILAQPLQGHVSEDTKLPFTGPYYKGNLQKDSLRGGTNLDQPMKPNRLHSESPEIDRLPFSGPNLQGQVNQELNRNPDDLKKLTPQQDSITSSKPNPLPFNSGFQPRGDSFRPDKPEWCLYIYTADTPCFDPIQNADTGTKAQIADFGRYDHRFTSRQLSTWNRWAENLLHMIYANLRTFPGKENSGSLLTIYLRNDGQLRVDADRNSNSGQAVTKSVEALYGMPELAFPGPASTDTILVRGDVFFGTPHSKLARDVWGRIKPEPSPSSMLPYSNRYMW